MGSKHRPFYRIVVANSSAGRNGSFIEILGTYNPVTQPKHLEIKDPEKVLQWLRNGAQPSETTAVLLQKVGILDRFFEERPTAKRHYKFLDKRTAAMSQETALEAAP